MAKSRLGAGVGAAAVPGVEVAIAEVDVGSAGAVRVGGGMVSVASRARAEGGMGEVKAGEAHPASVAARSNAKPNKNHFRLMQRKRTSRATWRL
jgi:hypothetical protein